MDQQVFDHIVELAGRAPSIHNTQPWRFVAHGDVLALWTDPSRGLAVIDPTGRARHLSCGAALVHARIAAAAAGYRADVRLRPDPAEPAHLADLTLVADAAAATGADASLAGAITSRRTAREPFAPGQLPDDVVRVLRQAVEQEGCWLRLVASADDATAVAVALSRADELEAADPAYLEELRRWTGAPEGGTSGIPASAVPETDPDERASNYRLRDFVVDRDPADDDTADPDRPPPPVERPLVVVLGTPDDDVPAWLGAGQALGRLLLTAEAHEVAASPMTQALEVPEVRARLTRELGLVGHPQMIVRMGPRAAASASPTPRRPLREVLDEEPPA